MLAYALARRKSVIFTEDRIFTFISLGVFSAEKLNLVFLAQEPEIDVAFGDTALVLIDCAKESDTFGLLDDMFFSIRICPLGSQVCEHWIWRGRSEMLVLDAMPLRFIIAASSLTNYPSATLQLCVAPTRQRLQQLLTCLLRAGPNTRFCYSLDESALSVPLREYLVSLSPPKLLEFAAKAHIRTSRACVARADSGPDLFLFRRDLVGFEDLCPIIATRWVMSEIYRLHVISGVTALRSMEVVRCHRDSLLQSRAWIFEHLCHALLLQETSKNLSRLALSQCFPFGASRRKGALKISHLGNE